MDVDSDSLADIWPDKAMDRLKGVGLNTILTREVDMTVATLATAWEETQMSNELREYLGSHPWLTFELHLENAPIQLWTMLGECRSKCEHLRRTPLRPETRTQLHRLYLAKGVQGTAAIEGNTLTEKQVQEAIDGKLEVPPSREYQKQEIDNIIAICNDIADRVLGNQDTALSFEWICEMHKRLFRDLDTEDHNPLGEIPEVSIGVAGYCGAPRADCDFLMQKLVQWIESEWSRVSEGEDRWADSLCVAILKAIMAHLYFVWIHPFGDGNGRTARLVEVQILARAGVPWPATQLLSNHYNQTRDRYYRELRRSSDSGGNVIPFLYYAVEGLRDQLTEQIGYVTEQQHRIFWNDYVYRSFRGETSDTARRRHDLALGISERNDPIERSEIRSLSPAIAVAYHELEDKTLWRDIAELKRMRLIEQLDDGRIKANRDLLLELMPASAIEEA